MSNPVDVFAVAAGRIRPRHISRLEALGVPPEAQAGARPLWGVLPITPHAVGTFEAAEEGRAAVLVAAGWSYGREWWSRIDDVVAFYPDEPGRWWVLADAVDSLGEEYLAIDADGGRAELVATPLDWLRRMGLAACIINWRADPRRIFVTTKTVECAAPVLEKRLRARIAELARPAFAITTARQAVAA